MPSVATFVCIAVPGGMPLSLLQRSAAMSPRLLCDDRPPLLDGCCYNRQMPSAADVLIVRSDMYTFDVSDSKSLSSNSSERSLC